VSRDFRCPDSREGFAAFASDAYVWVPPSKRYYGNIYNELSEAHKEIGTFNVDWSISTCDMTFGMTNFEGKRLDFGGMYSTDQKTGKLVYSNPLAETGASCPHGYTSTQALGQPADHVKFPGDNNLFYCWKEHTDASAMSEIRFGGIFSVNDDTKIKYRNYLNKTLIGLESLKKTDLNTLCAKDPQACQVAKTKYMRCPAGYMLGQAYGGAGDANLFYCYDDSRTRR